MRESIVLSSIRSFFIALFGMAGLILGIVGILALFSAFSLTTDGAPEIKYLYSPEVKPNAQGERIVESSTSPVILKININGVIGLDSLTRKAIAQQLIESREKDLGKDRVKAILLYIDSPGGTVVDADGIYREIKNYKEKYNIPVYAFVDGLCASGGYYIAAAADKIYAADTCLIGSVGVLIPSMFNFSQLMEKLGLESMTLSEGKGKDSLNPFKPWVKGDADNIQSIINYYYQMFVTIVTQNRPGLDKTKLIQEYGAHIFPAEIAKQQGYIDESGYNLQKTLVELISAAGITDEHYQVIELENTSWINELFSSRLSLLQGKITHQVELTKADSLALSNQFLYMYKP